MKLAVVIPTYNKCRFLQRTLVSLEHQTAAPDAFEVVVVDDGSTDDTATFLGSLRAEFTLRVVRLESNVGRAAARNRGIQRAAGELIVFLDDDIEVDPGFLRAHADAHARHERIAAVGNVSIHPAIRRAPIDEYLSTRGAQKIGAGKPLPWKYFSTNNSSVRRVDLEDVGGFDERFRFYGFEDLELAWRLERRRGLGFRFVPEARGLHMHPQGLDEVLRKKTLAGRSSLIHLFRTHPETRRLLGFERFDPPQRGQPIGENATRALLRSLFTPPVYAVVRPLAGLRLGRLTERILDYLVQYHYLEGLGQPLSPSHSDASLEPRLGRPEAE